MEANFAVSNAHRDVTNKVAVIAPRHLRTSRNANSKALARDEPQSRFYWLNEGQYKDAWKLGDSF